jgi:GT2 family glycosyltransferase
MKPDRAFDSKAISAIIPTLGRPKWLELCLTTIANQTQPIDDVVVVHCGIDKETQLLIQQGRWKQAGLDCRYYHFRQKNSAAQRDFAIKQARHNNLLLLDDDLELEPDWAKELFQPIWDDPRVGATMGRLVNQPMPQPTPLWRLYRSIVIRRFERVTPGKLVGAALPNGFPLNAIVPIPCEWLGGGCSAIRREAYESVGGFSSYFAGSSPGEDLDLGYRLSRQWRVLYVPTARCLHHSAREGREDVARHQYLSARSRFAIQHRAMGKTVRSAWIHTALWVLVQCVSECGQLLKGTIPKGLFACWAGRFRGLASCRNWRP